MKTRRWFFLTLMIAGMSCSSPEEVAPALPVSDDFDPGMSTLLKQGMLQGVGHTASGTASIYLTNDKLTLVLDPYSSQNGPDLKVYLSKDQEATEYLRLGNLKSTMGKQSYEVPGMPDIDDYHFVHVWCEKYTVVFARGEIK
jgi:hypothetical protein